MSDRNKASRKSRKSNEDKEDREEPTGKRGTSNRDPDSPPNERIQKDPDEVYGDTKIPHRGSR